MPENKFVTSPTAAAHWRSFSDTQKLETKHAIQRAEMRKAFYAGIASMMSINIAAANSTEEDAMQILESVRIEIVNFSNDQWDAQ